MARYRLSPSEKNLRRFIQSVFTTWDEDWAHYMGDALKGFNLNLQPPPLATESSLRDFKAPTLVFAAEHDIQFPGQKLLRRIPSLILQAQTELIAGSKHAPPMTDEFRVWLSQHIKSFLEN